MYLLNLALVATGVIVQFVQRTTPWDPITGAASAAGDLFVALIFAALLGVAVVALIPWPFVVSQFIKESHYANQPNSASPVSDLHHHCRIRGSEAGV